MERGSEQKIWTERGVGSPLSRAMILQPRLKCVAHCTIWWQELREYSGCYWHTDNIT